MPITIPVAVQVRTWGSTGAFTDLTPYIKLGGLKWSRNDVEHSSAGRGTQDGLMHRARVGIKVRLDCSSKPLLTDEARTLLRAIEPEWLEVKYLDPRYSTADYVSGQTTVPYVDSSGYRHAKMYSNNIPATFLFMNINGTSYWEGVDFPFIEQ